MVLVPLSSVRSYLGFAKQAVQGTAVAPTTFPRILDGSSIEYDLKTEDIKEGDTTRRLSQIIKNRQALKIKLVADLRPNEVAFFEGAAMGTASDVYTAPSTGTALTLSATAAPGATSVSISGNTGLTAVGTSYVALSQGMASEEIVPITTPGTGAGPYVYNIPATYNFGGGLLRNHASSDPVKGPASHVITDQLDGNYYTAELSLAGASGIVLRVRDCKVDTIKVSAKSGTAVTWEIELWGIACSVQGTPATVTLDTHNIFIFQQGVWTLDGATTGDAPNIESFDLTRKNAVDVVQTEGLTPAALIFGDLHADLSFDYVYQQASQRIQQTYFGGTAGTTDAQAMGTGSLLLLFTQADGFHTCQYNVPYLLYTKVSIPEYKADGKHWSQQVQASATSNQGANTTLLTTTVQNTTYAAVA